MITVFALNLLAVAALKVLPPEHAKRTVDAVGRRVPGRLDAPRARRAARFLQPIGTCLSRSIAIAARLPNASIVIAVRKQDDKESAGIHAHAWVECDGRPLRESDVVGDEIARL